MYKNSLKIFRAEFRQYLLSPCQFPHQYNTDIHCGVFIHSLQNSTAPGTTLSAVKYALVQKHLLVTDLGT